MRPFMSLAASFLTARIHAAGVALLLVGMLLVPARALADTNSFYGDYEDDVPIVLPPYHGIEPKLALHYSSSNGNGPVGVGWALTGFSLIERASPGGGTPKFTSSDIFLFEGQELVPCASGSLSPSCATGGNYSTKIENYARIVYDGHSFTITQNDGTKTTYAPVFTIPVAGVTQTWKWGVSSVKDPKGNTVTYSWSANAWSTCCWEYPTGVSYNGTAATLNWEQRTDVESRATGVGFANYYGRIKSIDIKVSGARARAYKLTYTSSGSTARSLLATVQQFGKDATLDSTGTVTGGTSTPAVTLTPTTITSSFTNDTEWALSAD
ncbi:MAG TPA: SpvB/TcaC N-terminal domain-containing protein, partial [Vicinamibacterales bacterium]|nr:SpvB/TcaC N-terminal domain-containing protein [Vicinamibacterales bacterium]